MNQKKAGGVMMRLILIFLMGITTFHVFAQEMALFPDQTEVEVGTDEFDTYSALQDPSYVRHRFLNIDLQSAWSLPVTNESETLTFAQAEPVIWTLELFPGIEFQVQVESSRSTQFGGSFIQGTIVNGGSGRMTLMLGKDGAIRGEVYSSEGFFTISNGGASTNRVLVQEINMPRSWSQENDVVEMEISPDMIRLTQTTEQDSEDDFSVESENAETQEDSSSESNNQIDVLVFYTEIARDTRTGSTSAAKTTAIKRDIQNEITKTNQALSNSGAEVRVRLVGMEEIPTSKYTQEKCMDTYLDTLAYTTGDGKDSSGELDYIHKNETTIFG